MAVRQRFDVVVLGSGAAGLTAALAAHDGGATVGLFEKDVLVGGTSAWSGGMVWIPVNPHMAELGIGDSREEVLTYLESLSHGLIDMNLAAPPFDDVDVRKAVNYVIDKRALVDAAGGGPLIGQAATHIAPDSLEENLLLNYDPYPTPGERGSLTLARKEMALSRYDRDGDGRCDAKVCEDVRAVSLGAPGTAPPFVVRDLRARARLIASDLSRIGIRVQVEFPEDAFAVVADPTQKVPLGLSTGWGKDIPTGSNFFEPLFSSEEIGMDNFTLVGASPDQLQDWGYDVSAIPSVDDRIDQCSALVGHDQVVCWANLDKYLMEEVVPWVPYVVESHADLVGSRVVHYSFDQSASMPAFDQIALKPST